MEGEAYRVFFAARRRRQTPRARPLQPKNKNQQQQPSAETPDVVHPLPQRPTGCPESSAKQYVSCRLIRTHVCAFFAAATSRLRDSEAGKSNSLTDATHTAQTPQPLDCRSKVYFQKDFSFASKK